MMPMMPMKPQMGEGESSGPSSSVLEALKQAQAALDDAIVQMTVKKREAPPATEAEEVEEVPAAGPIEEE